MARPTPRGLAYWLADTLYVSLTNRTRGLSLVASRGPSFTMPAESGFAPLAAEPTTTEVVTAVLDLYKNDERKRSLGADVGRTQRADGGKLDPGLVYAGLGDPLLRWQDLCDITREIRVVHPAIPIRINTNGLLPTQPAVGQEGGDIASAESVAASLAEAGVDHATVALNAGNPKAYADFMLTEPSSTLPIYRLADVDDDGGCGVINESPIGDVAGASFGDACAFVAALAEAQIGVTVSCVTRPGVDKNGMRKLAKALGAYDVKWRSYHPLDVKES